MTAEEKIRDFIRKDSEKMAAIIEKYPKQIPISVIADLWGCKEESIRRAVEEHGMFGIEFRQPGKLNRGFVIPTAAFTRWYMGIKS